MPAASPVPPWLDTDPSLFNFRSTVPGPAGRLPLTEELLRNAPSGDLFGWTHNVGMGWNPGELGRKEFLLLSTSGGLRADDGTPVALGYHTGHWEVGLLMKAAAEELKALGHIPFAGFCTDPCDGRTQGTPGMMDSLPYRNDAATIFRRLIRSLPTRTGVVGVATCDKGLPAMMMALASVHDLPSILVPGGVMLASSDGEDTARVQTIGARFAHGEITLEQAADMGCRSCASPGGGCQFLGTAATSQVVGEALGMALPHSALAPSGQPIWLDLARKSARAVSQLAARGLTMKDVLTDAAVRNAMTVHAAFGGSTNLVLHIPAIAYSAGLAVKRGDGDDQERREGQESRGQQAADRVSGGVPRPESREGGAAMAGDRAVPAAAHPQPQERQGAGQQHGPAAEEAAGTRFVVLRQAAQQQEGHRADGRAAGDPQAPAGGGLPGLVRGLGGLAGQEGAGRYPAQDPHGPGDGEHADDHGRAVTHDPADRGRVQAEESRFQAARPPGRQQPQ